VDKEALEYFLIRALIFPLRFLPFSWIHALGKFCGLIGFYCLRTYRKRALSHIALAKDLAFSNEEIIRTAKQSFQNLAINCLEYAKLSATKDLSQVIRCENPEVADALYAKGQGIVFFCAHQSNWEVLFLDGTARMKGVAIGKPIKNKRLYQWIVSIREKFGGTIITPKNAVKEGLRALKKGVFLGIVGDQAMPESHYWFPFLGRRASNSTAPALLAHRTNSPIIFAETHRVKGGYRIRYSDPIWPRPDQPMEKEVIRMMDQTLHLLQESIRRYPGEWLWQHNRWKQQTPQIIYHSFRHDSLCVILSEDPSLLPLLETLKQIYPLEHFTLIVPESLRSHSFPSVDELVTYKDISETLRNDLRPKIIFNFTSYELIERHYKRLSAFQVLTLTKLKQIAAPHGPVDNLSDVLKRALCRPGTLWNQNAV
jgi:KDO2-lipid IV(A) lauroyltransferase